MAECKAYHYAQRSYLLIHRNLTAETGESLHTDDDGQVYKKSKCDVIMPLTQFPNLKFQNYDFIIPNCKIQLHLKYHKSV